MANKDTSMKGQAGKSTGGSVRKTINKLQKKGLTNKQIGQKTNRSGSTIAKIDQGVIKNPPKSLATRIKGVKSGSKTKRK